MEKVYNFIKQNQRQVIIICIVIIVLLLSFFTIVFFRNNNEYLENVSNDDISNIVDKNVYLSCELEDLDKKGETKQYYLAISNKKDCHNLKDLSLGECGLNIPILQKQKNRFSLFQVSKHPSENRYALRSTMESLNMPYLTQNLNFYRNVNYLCFDNQIDDDIIFFEVEESNIGTLLKFRKMVAGVYKDFYVGVCSDLGLKCMQGPNAYRRLCVYGDSKYALPFKIEVAPQEVQPKSKEEIYKEVEEVQREKEVNFVDKKLIIPIVSVEGENVQEANIETFNDVSSLYSLQTNVSYDSLMDSLPGMNYIDNFCEYR